MCPYATSENTISYRARICVINAIRLDPLYLYAYTISEAYNLLSYYVTMFAPYSNSEGMCLYVGSIDISTDRKCNLIRCVTVVPTYQGQI